MRFALALVLALGAAPAQAQSYYSSGTAQFTTASPGVVTLKQTTPVPVLGTVAVSSLPAVAVSSLPAVTGVVSITGTPTVVTTQPPAGAADCSVSLPTSGTAYQVVPAGATRKALTIQNVSASNIGVSFTNTSPAIGTGGTFTLAAGAFLPVPPGLTQSGAVWAVGSASSLTLSCTLFN